MNNKGAQETWSYIDKHTDGRNVTKFVRAAGENDLGQYVKRVDDKTVIITKPSNKKDAELLMDIIEFALGRQNIRLNENTSNNIYSYVDFINEYNIEATHLLKLYEFAGELNEVRDKKPDHIEDNPVADDTDKKLEKEVDEYLDDKGDYCPRCEERLEDCKCTTKDPWSTRNYHRVPVGKKIESKPKQNFKQSNE